MYLFATICFVMFVFKLLNKYYLHPSDYLILFLKSGSLLVQNEEKRSVLGAGKVREREEM